MSDMIALLNDLSYIPPNNEQNEPIQEDIGETSNEPTQAKRNEFEELYASANEELYPGCDYVTRLDFMAKFTYFKVKGFMGTERCRDYRCCYRQKFNMRAMVLWTINDFPARSSLSGWSGKGYRVCPICNEDTPSMYVLGKIAYVGHRRFLKKTHKWRRSLEFNGEIENRDHPRKFDRDQIQAQLARLPTHTAKARQDLKRLGIEVACGLAKPKPRSARSLTPKIDTYRSQFKSKFPNKDMKEEFPDWFGSQISQRHIDNDPGVSVTSELFALACGPTPNPISVNSCVVNGVRFVVHNRDELRTTQNSGICSPGGKDGEMYYGQLQEILEFLYLSFKVVLFRVKWVDTSNEGRKVKHLVLRNNMTQISTKGEAFKDDQYILATEVKQCFYLEDMEDPDVIHFDNSSDLPLSTSLNDMDNATLHIDGQSTVVDVPLDIIDLDEDDDIIDDEDALPYDLVDSDDEDLINVDDDDGVDVMSADVARGHGGDGGGDDRPPTHHIPTGCRGCFANRGKGTRKPNLGGRKAGRLHTCQETHNLELKKITNDKGPVPIRFEWDNKKTMMPLGDHASHWSNYLGELIKEMPLYYPSWQNVPAEQKAAILTKIRTQFDLKLHMQSQGWTDNAGIQQHLKKLQRRPESITPADWDAQLAFWNDPRNQARAAQNRQNEAKSTVVCQQGSRSLSRLRDQMMESSSTQAYPSLIDTFFMTHTVGGVFVRDEDQALHNAGPTKLLRKVTWERIPGELSLATCLPGKARNFVGDNGYENMSFDERDCRNYIAKVRQLRLGVGDAEALRDYFVRMQRQSPKFFYALDIEDEGRLKNVFWADARSRTAYESFGDVITFDNT
ncbi:retrotransposon protein, putative, ty3-gypsy subclass [Tanacetum coccineum]